MCLISKKLFCTYKATHKDWIHKNIFIKNEERRLYDTSKYGCEQMFWNEIGLFFEYMLNQNLKIFYISSSPKHNIIYDKECFNFFKSLKNFTEDVIIPENVKKLRKLQSDDLMYFYDNLILENFWILSEIKNDLYYYNMIIIVKNNFNVNDFYKINFNIINIESITPIFYENITYTYMQKLFDFEKLESYAFSYFLGPNYNDIIYNPKFKETQEYINLENYENRQYELKNSNYQHNDPMFWYYSNEYCGAESEMLDQKLMFKHYFSQFGWHWFYLNYNFRDMYAVEAEKFTYPVNEPFLLTLDSFPIPMVVIKQGGEIKEYNQEYEFGCMFELLDNLNGCANYCISSDIISIPKIKYNTSYKCRLNKNNKK